MSEAFHPGGEAYRQMQVAVDFDNTIVCYDELFRRLAWERSLIPPDLPGTKAHVRDFLRRADQEQAWTRLQGLVYGPRMSEAKPFPGVLAFFRQCKRWGVHPLIISHRSRTPYAGEPYDLHESALNWLSQQAFFEADGGGLRREDVFLELTKEAKLLRIAASGCCVFLDDLPEFLADPAFAAGVQRVLFDPAGSYLTEARFSRVTCWREFARMIQTRIGGHAHP